jgi:hypothetical protein
MSRLRGFCRPMPLAKRQHRATKFKPADVLFQIKTEFPIPSFPPLPNVLGHTLCESELVRTGAG